MNESDVITKDLKIIKDFLNRPIFQIDQPAYAVSAVWLKTVKESLGIGYNPTGKAVCPIDNSDIVDYLNMKIDVDYCVVNLEVWNVFQKLFGGGPVIEVEVAFDPKTCVCVPITKLHPFRVCYEGKWEKIMISKYKSVSCLITEACKALDVPPGDYRIRDYWGHKPGKYLMPNQIICQHSLFVNTEMILESGDYSNIIDDDEHSRSTSTSTSRSLQPFQPKTTFGDLTSQKVLVSPEFHNTLMNTRRSSHQMKIVSLEPQEITKKKMQATVKDRNMKTESFFFHRNSNPNINIKSSFIGEKRISAPSIHVIKDIPLFSNEAVAKGLIDIGSSHYLNAILQCLVHLKPLKDYFLSKDVEKDITKNGISEQNKVPAVAFANFVRNYYSSGDTSISPHDIRTLVDKSGPYMSSYVQHGPNDLLTALLNVLNESLKLKKGVREEVIDPDPSNKQWKEHMLCNNTVIAKLFHGQVESCSTCTKCQKNITTYSPCVSILLQLPSPKVLSPRFIFVPSDPRKPKVSMRFPIPNKLIYKDGFMSALSAELGKQISCVFGLLDPNGIIEWIPSPNIIIGETRALIVFEISDPSAMHVQVKLSVNTNKFISPIRVIDGPFLIEIPSREMTTSSIRTIIGDYFSYLWEPSDNGTISQELSSLIPNIKSNSSAKYKIDIELEKSMFSKKIKFKPVNESPCVSTRTVTAVIQNTESISWANAVRPILKNITNTLKNEVSLATLINDAATPSLYAGMWKCPSCGKQGKAEKAQKFCRLPPILVFSIKRFEENRNVPKKNDMAVTFPDVLNLKDVAGDRTYELSSLCEYRGSLNFCNYVAYVKMDEETWDEFNDAAIFKRTLEEVHKAEAYMLFYTEKDL